MLGGQFYNTTRIVPRITLTTDIHTSGKWETSAPDAPAPESAAPAQAAQRGHLYIEPALSSAALFAPYIKGFDYC